MLVGVLSLLALRVVAVDETCDCKNTYAPVCSSDNKTYRNDCLAKCAKAAKWIEGECPEKRTVNDTIDSLDDEIGEEIKQDQNVENKGEKEVPKIDEKPKVEEPKKVAEEPRKDVEEPKKEVKETNKKDEVKPVPPAVELEKGNRIRPDCICIALYAPVCGVDGKTYGNSCNLGCAGVLLDYEGECGTRKPICTCPYIYLPVCSTTGKTYSNQCLLKCAGETLDYDRACVFGGKRCLCDSNYAPVCGSNKQTYDNACKAECNGIYVYTTGNCDPCQNCPQSYYPVCGSDGRTYSNECKLRCAKKELKSLGECPQSPRRGRCDCYRPYWIGILPPEPCPLDCYITY